MAEQEKWTTLKVLNWTKEYLLLKGIANARLEAEWLLCAATGLDRVGLYLNYDKPLDEHELAAYRTMTARRAKREPLQHILGTQEFFGLEFEVSHDVLVPRHDTEILVSEALLRISETSAALDIGTGSGCIAIAIKAHAPESSVWATDLSEAALAVAQRNAVRNQVSIEFRHGDLFAPLAGQQFDLIVSNPPYIPSADIATLEPEVREFDPLSALDGGADGLKLYRKIIPEALGFLTNNGWLLLEIGIHQEDDVIKLINSAGSYLQPLSVKDHGGITRVICAQKES